MSDARVDQARDAWMYKLRQHLTFAPEPLGAAVPHQREVQEFDRGLTLEAAVAAMSEPDAAHTSLTQQMVDGVAADDLAGQRRLFRQRAALEECLAIDRGLACEQYFQLSGKPGVGAPDFCEPRGALAGIGVQQIVE